MAPTSPRDTIEPMRILTNVDPARLKKWLIAIAVIYVLFPRDLIPDYLGRGLGLIDDASVIAFFTWLFRRHAREWAQRGFAGAGGDAGPRPSPPPPLQAEPRAPEAHEVLGVAKSATKAEIDSAYKARMKEYHPDKVAHLGQELQDLAHRKVLEIQAAYARLRK